MKTNKLLMGAALLTAGLTACNSDAPFADNTPQTVDSDQTRFLAVEISAPKADLTRAFEDGTPNESHVARLDFIFYDAAGEPTGKVQSIESADLNDEFTDFGTTTDNVTRIWTSVVPVELTQGQNLPAQVICLVNSTEDVVNQISLQSLNELRNREVTYFSHNNEFLMSNSVYYDTNQLTGQANQRICATYINPNDQLFDNADEAEEAIRNATDADQTALVNIFVERVAAKAGLTMNASAVEDYVITNAEGGTVTLKFVPEYWFLSALDKTAFVTKRYGTSDDITIDATYDEINEAMTNTTTGGVLIDWNDPENHRSYWGVGPSYFKNKYPYTADDVNDLEGTATSNHAADYDVVYYSYNQVVTEAAKTGIEKQALAATNGGFTTSNTGEAATGYLYGRGTTTNIETIRNVDDNPAATVASAVLVGKYTVNGADSEKFYVDPFTNNNKGTYYGSEEIALTTLLGRQRTLFADNQGTRRYGTSETDNLSFFEVSHPTTAVREEMSNLGMNSYLAGRIVSLQLKNAPTGGGLWFYNTTNGEYELVTEENLALVNAQLVQTAGTFNMYNNGRAFFNIPIRHLGFQASSYKNEGTSQNPRYVYDWANMKAGELGFVRNHVYNMTVDKITGLGNGLRSDDQPIVPTKDDMTQYVAMRLNILAWNVVNSWSVSF